MTADPDADPRGFTYTETYRHQCEVRQLIAWRAEFGRSWVHGYINGVEKTLASSKKVWERKGVRQQRGDAAADRLLADCTTQFQLGNDGTSGAWMS